MSIDVVMPRPLVISEGIVWIAYFLFLLARGLLGAINHILSSHGRDRCCARIRSISRGLVQTSPESIRILTLVRHSRPVLRPDIEVFNLKVAAQPNRGADK